MIDVNDEICACILGHTRIRPLFSRILPFQCLFGYLLRFEVSLGWQMPCVGEIGSMGSLEDSPCQD